MEVEDQDQVVRQWFYESAHKRTWRWVIDRIADKYGFYLNPESEDAEECAVRRFASLRPLALTYIAIDELSTTHRVSCSSIVEVLTYIVTNDVGISLKNFPKMPLWDRYMRDIYRQLEFRPDFTAWDKHTRELERLAKSALNKSIEVIEEHNPPEKRLPQEVLNGIYVRINVLQEWIKKSLIPIRNSSDYVEWKSNQSRLFQSNELRRRPGHGGENTTPLNTEHAQAITSQYSQGQTLIQKLSASLQDDLTIWIINLAIYFPCVAIQTAACSLQPSNEPSAAEYLSAVQTTLTQLFSSLMIFILMNRKPDNQDLNVRYKAWFILSGTLPVAALIILRWHAGVSGLLAFMGTALTGCLQTMLVIDKKGVKQSSL